MKIYPEKLGIQCQSSGKEKGLKRKKVVVYVDATIALPLIAHALYERLGNKKRRKKDLSWIYENLPEI